MCGVYMCAVCDAVCMCGVRKVMIIRMCMRVVWCGVCCFLVLAEQCANVIANLQSDDH